MIKTLSRVESEMARTLEIEFKEIETELKKLLHQPTSGRQTERVEA